MIDSRAGAWGLDKREYQRGLPRHLSRPPYCVAEATQKLWSLLHDAMAAHDVSPTRSGPCDGCTSAEPWPENPALLDLITHDKTVRAGIERLPQVGDASLALVGTGPWSLSREGGVQGTDGGFFFLRGGQLETPWGSAAWAASPTTPDAMPPPNGDPMVIYLCGRTKWTHSIRFKDSSAADAAGKRRADGAEGLPRGTVLLVTPRAGGETQTMTLDSPAAAQSPRWNHALWPSHVDIPAPPSTQGPQSPTLKERLAALVGKEDAPRDADESAIRRRLLGTGPWRLNGPHGVVHLLDAGVAHVSAWTREGVRGRWGAYLDQSSGAAYILLQYPPPDGSVRLRAVRLKLRCWHMEEVMEEGQRDSNRGVADLVWSRPASRCFPTCSDATHTLVDGEQSSKLAQHVMNTKGSWSWAGIPGMHFQFEAAHGGGVLVTPWGHGTWGIVPSRDDVLVAEFAQKRHMLRFEKPALSAFVSTRCDDGELVQGRMVA